MMYYETSSQSLTNGGTQAEADPCERNGPLTILATMLLALAMFQARSTVSAAAKTRQFHVWATSCSHVPADIRKGRESLAKAIRQSEGREPSAPEFDWDIMVDAGDLSAHQKPPGDRDGEELQRQYRALNKHRREQVYNVPGNHDAPYYDLGAGSWFRKWGDPLGRNTEFSGVDPKRRPFPVDGTWERYRFQAGNILFLMLADRNDAPTPVGRGHSREAKSGGFPAGAVTRETFEWWRRQVLDNHDKIIVTMHHHVLRDTTVGSGRGEGHPRYHGSSGGAEGASYLYYLIENDDPDRFRYTEDAHVFEDFLAAYHRQHGHGAIDLWIGGHTHVKGPDDNWGGKSITETRWGVGFLQVAALTRHHAGSHPMSRLLTFSDGSDRLRVRLYLHEATYKDHPVGWYASAERNLSLRHRFVAPPPIAELPPFPESAKVFNQPYAPAQLKRPRPDSAKEIVSVETDVEIPMRDGTVLRADLFRPTGTGTYPVLMARTPYGRRGLHRDARHFAAHGYIVICQDARGRYGSDGEWESFVAFDSHDAEDGYDTIQWCADPQTLPGANGKVGTFGASYNAFLQWRTASLAPPALVCMSAQSIPAKYTQLEGPGSIRPGRRLQWWNMMTRNVRARNGKPESDYDREKWLDFVPIGELPRKQWEHELDEVHAWLREPHRDPWALHEGITNVTVPNLDVIGWHDHCNGDLLLHRTMVRDAKTEVARMKSQTIVGPWSHTGRGGTRVGKIDFTSEARVDIKDEMLRWFDYWLKDKPNGVDQQPPFRIFVMGDNNWRDEAEWPLKRTRTRTLYLTSSGNANTPNGNGKLADLPPSESNTDEFRYDPADPVPTQYGDSAFTVPADQNPLAERRDILVYQTKPLTERIEVTGNPVVVLYASTTAADTDFFARLIDVSPDGTAVDVSMGLVRAKYRNGRDKPPLAISPNNVVRYEIRLRPTSNAFHPGHRIRLDITSSDFPNYNRNHNIAGNPNFDPTFVVADQTVHHGGTHKSCLQLPWIPNNN